MKLSTRRLLSLLPLLLSSACAMLPSAPGNLYEMRREAQAAYAGSEDERAEKLLLGLTRAVPNDAETWFYLGNLYARTNRPEQATQAYQKALMLNSGDSRAWHNIGVVRLREAWAAFIQAYDLSTPDNPLHAKIEALINAMEKIPLEGLSRSARATSSAPRDAQK
ncbi:MAG: tetratricopeptide repeat protein [Herminiimonas sp.]|nr:tetratricopeptide repeat protein [Herminiimonas sp.]